MTRVRRLQFAALLCTLFVALLVVPLGLSRSRVSELVFIEFTFDARAPVYWAEFDRVAWSVFGRSWVVCTLDIVWTEETYQSNIRKVLPAEAMQLIRDDMEDQRLGPNDPLPTNYQAPALPYTAGQRLAYQAAGGLFVLSYAALLAALVYHLWKLTRRIVYGVPGRCRRCDYDLGGLPANLCPECGTLPRSRARLPL